MVFKFDPHYSTACMASPKPIPSNGTASAYALVRLEKALEKVPYGPTAHVACSSERAIVPDIMRVINRKEKTYLIRARTTRGRRIFDATLNVFAITRTPMGAKVHVHADSPCQIFVRNTESAHSREVHTSSSGDFPKQLTILNLNEGDIVRFGGDPIVDGERNPFVYIFTKVRRANEKRVAGCANLHCGVCRDYLVDPHHTDCMHAMCLSCVHAIMNTAERKCIKCGEPLKGKLRASSGHASMIKNNIEPWLDPNDRFYRRARQLFARIDHRRVVTMVRDAGKSGCIA